MKARGMSLEHSPQRQKKRGRLRLADRVCVSVSEICELTGISKPSAYRMMADGRLQYVQMGERTRKIPTSEYERLGLVASEAAA